MGIETIKNHGQDDRNSLLNKGIETDLPQKDADDDKTEKEINTPSQPAEEQLITEADDLPNNDSKQDISSFEDPDQGPEEIDPVLHPRKFKYISP